MKKISLIVVATAFLAVFYFIHSEKVEAIDHLQRNFLKNDLTAISIINGLLSNYDIKSFFYVYGGQWVSTDSFAYRIVSAIRQLGYSQSVNTVGGQYPAEILLNKLQRLNGLPVTNIITKDILLKIDSMLVGSENLDNSLGQDFPLYSRMLSAPLNEPSKEHLARIMDVDFRALPFNLTIWSESNFKGFASVQLLGSLGPLPLDNNYKFCESFYYGELGDTCEFRGNSIVVFNDDYDMANLFLHEYAHFLDANLYGKVSGMSSGIINPAGFYAISFDTSKEKIDSSGWRFYPYRRGLSSRASEFVSSYATGWQIGTNEDYFTAFEDFAESFVFYVQGGNIFRELGRGNSYLQQKYDWLKQNVFGGIEYNTGIAGNIRLLQNNPKGSYGNLVFNTLQYAKINDDHVFNYNYARLNSTPTPTPTPSITPTPTPTPTCYWWEGQCQSTPTPTPAPITSPVEAIRFDNDPMVYVVQETKIKWVPSPDVFNSLGLDWASIEVIPASQKTNFQRAKLLRAENDQKVYYITESGLKRHIPNIETFNSYGNLWQDVVVVKDFELSAITDNQLIRQTGDSKVYKLENGQKHWIETAEAFNRLGLNWAQIAPVNSVEINSYPEGSAIE